MTKPVVEASPETQQSRESNMKQSAGSMTARLGGRDKTMSLSEDVRPLLAARAATDPSAARLLEMFTKADEILSEHSLERIGDVEMRRLARVPTGLLS
jgi:hypothetical protein